MNLPMRSFCICIPQNIKKIDVDEVLVDVVEEVVGFSFVGRSLETLNKDQIIPLSHITSIRGLQKEGSSHRLEASSHTTIDSFFWLV